MSHMSLSEAITTVARFSKMFEAVQTVAAEIDKVEKIKQLANEAESRVAGYADKEKVAQQKLAGLNMQIESAMAREAAIAGKLSADAQEASNRMIEKARFEAQSILAQAEKMAAETRAKADADVAPLIKKAAEATSDWVDLSGKIEAGKKELSDLQAKIDDAREKIAALMRV